MKNQPPGHANQHDAPRFEHVGKDPGEPTGQSGSGSVNGKDQRGIAGAETKIDDVFREKRLLDTIARHAENDGDVAAEQRQWHSEKMTVVVTARLRGGFRSGLTHLADSSTTICSLISAGRPCAARSNAAMLSSKEKFAEMSGLRSTLPDASNATAFGYTFA